MSNKRNLNELSRLKKSLLMLLMSATLGLTGCGEKEEKTFTETLTEVEDDTCLDDVIENNDSIILDEVSRLEEYLKLSDDLAKVKLDDIYVTAEQLSENILLDASEIRTLLEEYSKDKSNDELLFKLNVQKDLVNNFILERGYQIAAEISLLTFKSKISDEFDFATDVSVALANSIKVPSMSDSNYNNPYVETWMDSIYVGDNEVVLNNDFMSLLSNVYQMQENTGNVGYDYKEERNKLISDTLAHTKKVLVKEYDLKIK